MLVCVMWLVVLLLMLHNHFSLSAILDLSAHSTARAAAMRPVQSSAKHTRAHAGPVHTNSALQRHNNNECQGMTH